MKSKEIVLGNLQAKIAEWQKGYNLLKDLPDEMFEAGFAGIGSQQEFQIPSVTNDVVDKKEYGEKKRFVKAIISNEKNGIKRGDIIKKYELSRPGETNVAAVVTNALTGLFKAGEIELHKPKGRKGRGGYWRVKAIQ